MFRAYEDIRNETKLAKLKLQFDEFRKAVIYPKGINFWKWVGVQAKIWGVKNYGATFKTRILESDNIRQLLGCAQDLESNIRRYVDT